MKKLNRLFLLYLAILSICTGCNEVDVKCKTLKVNIIYNIDSSKSCKNSNTVVFLHDTIIGNPIIQWIENGKSYSRQFVIVNDNYMGIYKSYLILPKVDFTIILDTHTMHIQNSTNIDICAYQIHYFPKMKKSIIFAANYIPLYM